MPKGQQRGKEMKKPKQDRTPTPVSAPVVDPATIAIPSKRRKRK